MVHLVALPKSPTVMFKTSSNRDRPCATLRLSLNPVRSRIVQDLRLLPTLLLSISQSPSILFFPSVFLADKCVFQDHVKQQEAAKPCQIGKIVCFLHPKMLPFKKILGLRPEPRWVAHRPPDPHLQSTSIYCWLRPCLGICLEVLFSCTTNSYAGQPFSNS